MVKVAILGATDYAALELIRILLGHPEVEITALTSRQEGAPHIHAVHPSLYGRLDLTCEDLTPAEVAERADFAFCALDEILNKAGKWRYTHGANDGMRLPIVFLVMIGGYVSAASEHSQSPLGLYMHAQGLKLAVPTTPHDAMGLLKTAVRDDNPVILVTHKLLMDTEGEVPEEE